MKPVTAWGRLTHDLHDVQVLTDRTHVAPVLAARQPGLAYGNGRSYGDVCLNPNGLLWHTTGLNKLIAFDDTSGRLVCEAGVLLRDIQRLMIPRGTQTAWEWFQDFDAFQIPVLGARMPRGGWSGVAAIEAELDRVLAA